MARSEYGTLPASLPPFVFGSGPISSPGIIVGEAPGAEEEAQGKPFVGLSGKLLNEALEAAGISRSQVYVTNAYKRRPPGSRNPTEAELEAHRGLLEAELSRPELVACLTLGNIALGALTGRGSGITTRRGKWEYGDIMPTYHPAYVLRRGGRDTFAAHEFFSDVRKFVERAYG